MCYACGSATPENERPEFRDVCPVCGHPLHVCRNCRFYKPGAHWDCVETVGEPVNDKEKGNFCEWFSMAKVRDEAFGAEERESRSARSKFDDLFKN